MSLARSGTRRQAYLTNLTPVPAGPNKPKMTLDKVQQGIKVLKQPPEGSKPEVDIVFVPGLGTDPERSWESDTTKFNWITDQKEGLARDFPKARLMLYQYESAWTGDLKVNQYMRNIANTMLVDLHDKREAHANLPLVFIGHSMGGLVIAKAITLADSSRDRFPTMSECISGCLFFGTPFHGTPAASMASMFAVFGEKLNQTTSSKLLELMKPGDETLRELRTDFLRLSSKLTPKTELFSFYEEQPTNFAQQAGLPAVLGGAIPKKITEFVGRDSATMNGTIDEMGLASNHRNLVKFDGPKDSRYQLMRAPLKRIVHASPLLVKARINSTRNIDRDTVLDVKKALEGPDGQSLRRKLDPKHSLSSWLKDAQEYREWLYDSSHNMQRTDVIWIRGQVGRGKTTNTISVLNDLEKRTAELPENSSREVQPLVVYFFCEGAADRLTAEDVLKSFLLQLIEQQEALASYAKHFAKKKKGKDDPRENTRSALQPTVENLWQTIQDMMYDPFVRNTIYFVINNLHFLPEDSSSTQKLLTYIRAEVSNLASPDSKRVPVRWFISSRSSDSIDNVLREPHVRLVDLEDEKYEDQVQKELRKHAFTKVSALRKEKNYDRDVAYFAHSLIGKRAQNMQWIDITYLHLKALPGDDSRLKVRQILDTMPQDVNMLLENAWQQVFRQNINVVEKIKEMLRALVLTFEDPIAPELAVLAGMSLSNDGKEELRQLVEKCKPLLTTKRETDSDEVTIAFTNVVVKGHLLENSKKLLGLSEDETKWQHGMLAFRSFEHLTEKFVAVVVPEPKDEDEEGDDQGGEPGDEDEEPEGDDDNALSDTKSEGGAIAAPEAVEEEKDIGNYDAWSEDSSENSGDDEESEAEDDAEELDPEEEAVKDVAMAYMVKYWLRHAGCATKEIAEDLTAAGDNDFWTKDSIIRRRWLLEFARLDGRLNGWPVRSMSALHVAAAVGFPDLVDALIKDGHRPEIDDIDEWDNTPLHLAANFDQVDVVDVLLKSGAAIDHGKEKAVQTPLHMASFKGYVRVMKKLVALGADINAFANDAGPVLNAAIGSGNREAVELLIDKGVELSFEANENADIPPPLAAAALNSDTTLFDFLISKVADKLPARDYDQALRYAAKAGQTEVFEKLLVYEHPQETYQAAMDMAAKEGEWGIVKTILERRTGLECHKVFVKAAIAFEDQSDILHAVWEHTDERLPINTINAALYNATDYENANIVRILLEEFGADPNAEASENDEDEEDDGNYGNTLTAAANDGTIDIIKMLLDRGANVNSPAGWPLQAAAGQGHMNVIQELIDRGADINAMTTNENYLGGTALQVACRYGQTEIARLLLEHGADPNLGGGELACPLIAATANGEEEETKMLLDKKVAVNVYGGPYHGTPLMHAAAWLSVESVELIIQAGADIDLSDDDGDTALIWAARRGDSDCVRVMLENDANIMHTNHDGKNALQIALEKENTDCVAMLVEAVSKILVSLKKAVDAGDETAVRIVQDAGVKEPTKAASEEHIDVGETEHESESDEEEPADEARSDISGSEAHQTGPPQATRNADTSWHDDASSDGTPYMPETSTSAVVSPPQPQQDISNVNNNVQEAPQRERWGRESVPSPSQFPIPPTNSKLRADTMIQPPIQNRQNQGDYSAEPVNRTERVGTTPERRDSSERTGPETSSTPTWQERADYATQLNEPRLRDRTDYTQNIPYQPYNPGQPTRQQTAPTNYPTPYNTQPLPNPAYNIQPQRQQTFPQSQPQPPLTQPYTTNPQPPQTYEPSPYIIPGNQPTYPIHLGPGSNYPPSQPTIPYQSYNQNQPTYDGSSYGGQAQGQQQSSRPELNERTSSSSLFGMKDSLEKAKQFGMMNRWRS